MSYTVKGMRGICDVTVEQSRIDLLREVFPILEGITKEAVLEEISEEDVAQSYERLCKLSRKFTSHAAEQGVDLKEALRNLKWGANGHQISTAKMVRREVTQHGYNFNSPYDRKVFSDWEEQWLQLFRTEELDYRISNAIEDFDLLGRIPGVDGEEVEGGGHKSCFHPHSSYCNDAPVALALGFGRGANTFVVLVSKNGNILGRCWGIIVTPQCWVITNGYYAKTGINRDISVFAKATSAAHGDDMALVRCGTDYKFDARLEYSLPVSTNQDTMLVHTKGSSIDLRSVANSMAYSRDREYDGCHVCGCGLHQGIDFIHMFCLQCKNGDGLGCEKCGERSADPKDTSYGCPQCGYGKCKECYMDSHSKCMKCHKVICGVVNHGIFKPWEGEFPAGYFYHSMAIGNYCHECAEETKEKCVGCGKWSPSGEFRHCDDCGKRTCYECHRTTHRECDSCCRMICKNTGAEYGTRTRKPYTYGYTSMGSINCRSCYQTNVLDVPRPKCAVCGVKSSYYLDCPCGATVCTLCGQHCDGSGNY